MTEFLSLKDAVKKYLKNNMTVALEGFTHLIPFASAHEIIRQQYKELTLIRMTPDIIYDQLIGTGCAKKVIFSYAGNPGVGLLRRMRDSIENGWPHKIDISEHSHSAMANAYHAGASKLPFALLKGYYGTDLPKFNSEIKSIKCPFTGEVLTAIPALRPDVTFIHAQKADIKGNVLIEGIVGIQKEAALAAQYCIVTVEEVVEELNHHKNSVIIPSWTVSAISVARGGAHPSYTHGYYKRDNKFYLEWDKIAANRDEFMQWIDTHVMKKPVNDFVHKATKN